MKCTARTKYIAGVDVYPPAMEECGTEMEKIGEITKLVDVTETRHGQLIGRKEQTPATLYQCKVCKSIKLD